VAWSTSDFIAAALVGIGPACAPHRAERAVVAREAVRTEVNNLMIISMLCGNAWHGPTISWAALSRRA
jgi:hypothetical protein